ncbi:protein TonB [Bradyrhizobium sp. R2.2-H]|jgi:protein TonB|uniref:energy transducer TonB family protein n=2 Tax=unclassified Bradyrhizobium TaxID=2631580 RepID=UPI00105080BB|nr:energy transducer TonB [Bradyrhizobium sp. Y-H1]TCU73473.1 protein TonB [Bradyrhizobium sp. Y-H1]TCU76338.1 protein TonB [Bradyrhizobium sp. R2.2-H]
MQMKFLLLLAGLLGLLAAFPAHAQTDTQTERVTAWKARLTEHIVGNRLFPIEAPRQPGHAKIKFVIGRSGQLISRTLVEDTGSRQLDAAVLAIFDRAQPFPEPPAELKGDKFSFTVPIVFSLRYFQVPPYGLAASEPTPAFALSDALDAWRKAVTEHVWRNRVFPPEAIERKGDAGVTFVVDRSGKLISNALVESTGFAPLDAATLAMVERSVPFPKPPAEAKDDLQRISVFMTFDGMGGPWADEAKVKAKLNGLCRGC